MRKERPGGPIVTNAERKKEKGFPREPRAERLSGTAEGMDLQRGASGGEHINIAVLLIALAGRKQAYARSIFISII